ncbi:MAG: hypothetical protein AAGK04_00110 [Planctomycetota bacterium]
MGLCVISTDALAANDLWDERRPVRMEHATTTLLGDDLSKLAPMVPELVIHKLRDKKAERHPALMRFAGGETN